MVWVMRFSVLSSGSRANCTYVEAQGTAILIDCGLSGRKTEDRLKMVGANPSKLSAIIVTHEHHDHIAGIASFSSKHRIPVYVNDGAKRSIRNPWGIERFVTGEKFSIGHLEIEPFPVIHDAKDPVGFRISSEGLIFAQATDLGRVTTVVEEHLSGAHAMLLESNHDQGLLSSCAYPNVLKERIASAYGHLSNDDAGALLSKLLHSDLCSVVLGHISENSNTAEHAYNTVSEYLSYIPSIFTCASVREPLPMIEVGGDKLNRIDSSLVPRQENFFTTRPARH